MEILGLPYPITKHPNGFLRTQKGIPQIKSDILTLLLTNPGERVMIPEFGTPLRELLFEQNDNETAVRAREMIILAINKWEPRVVVTEINTSLEVDDLNQDQFTESNSHVLFISIKFSTFDNINNVEEVRLELPVGN